MSNLEQASNFEAEQLIESKAEATELVPKPNRLRRFMLFGCTLALAFACLENGGEAKTTYADGPTSTIIPTAIVDIPATLIAEQRTQLADLRTQVAAKTPVAIATPVSPAPVSPGVVVVPVPQSNPGPGPDVVVVHPEVVKPEVVKPEIIKVPEIVTVQVPVTNTPNPNILSLTREDLDKLINNGVKAELTSIAEHAAPTSTPTPSTPTIIRTEVEKEGYPLGTALVWGAVGLLAGLGVGAYAFTRRVIVERRYHRYHPQGGP